MKFASIVVVPSPAHGWDVLVTDLLSPGIVIHTTRSLGDANMVCVALAWGIAAPAHPVTRPS